MEMSEKKKISLFLKELKVQRGVNLWGKEKKVLFTVISSVTGTYIISPKFLYNQGH